MQAALTPSLACGCRRANGTHPHSCTARRKQSAQHNHCTADNNPCRNNALSSDQLAAGYEARSLAWQLAGRRLASQKETARQLEFWKHVPPLATLHSMSAGSQAPLWHSLLLRQCVVEPAGRSACAAEVQNWNSSAAGLGAGWAPPSILHCTPARGSTRFATTTPHRAFQESVTERQVLAVGGPGAWPAIDHLALHLRPNSGKSQFHAGGSVSVCSERVQRTANR